MDDMYHCPGCKRKTKETGLVDCPICGRPKDSPRFTGGIMYREEKEVGYLDELFE